MQKTKLVQLMEAFPKKDLNAFGRYINTDFFNRKERLKQLARILIDCIKGKRAWKTRAALYKQLFPEEAEQVAAMATEQKASHIGKRMDALNHELKTHLENYLVWKQGQEKGFYRDRCLLAAYGALPKQQPFLDHFERMEATLQSEDGRSTTDYLYTYILGDMMMNKIEFENLPVFSRVFVKMHESLDAFFVMMRLRNCWSKLIQNFFKNKDHDPKYLAETLALADDPDLHNHVFIAVFRRAIMDLQQRSFTWEGYHYLESRILPSLAKLAVEDQNKLFRLLLNYGVLMTQFNPECKVGDHFKLYMLGIEKGYFLNKGIVNEVDFHNCAASATRAGNLDWAENFVKTHGQFLPESVRNATVNLELSLIYLTRGNYRAALDFLQDTTGMFMFQVHIIRTKCYYALNDTDRLEHALEAFRRFTYREKKMGSEQLKLAQALMRHTAKLHHARNSPKRKSMALQLLEELQSKDKIMGKEWLVMETKKLL